MDRRLEPQLIDDHEAVTVLAESFSQAEADFFLDCLEKYFPNSIFLETLDLCCGTGDFAIALSEIKSGNIDAIDGSAPIIEIARKNISEAGLENRIKTKQLYVPFFIEKKYDFIFSLNSLHHFHNPADLWSTIKTHSKEKTKILVIDLHRPDNEKTARDIVEFYEKGESKYHQIEAYNSLLAAFKFEEVVAQLKDAKLDLNVEKIKTKFDGFYITVIWGEL